MDYYLQFEQKENKKKKGKKSFSAIPGITLEE